MQIEIKRAYAAPGASDGWRVLVDRVWPRGRSREELKLDAWLKDVAPTAELRKWFGHDPARWPEFRGRYLEELARNPAARELALELEKREKVTLVYGARDEGHNQAVVLKEYLSGRG